MNDLNRVIDMQPVFYIYAIFIAIFAGTVFFKNEEVKNIGETWEENQKEKSENERVESNQRAKDKESE